MTADMLTGRTEAHLGAWGNFRVHQGMLDSFSRLCARADRAGFDLQIVSAFRSFSAQLKIWNEKATGKRPLLDAVGHALDFSSLSEKEIVFSILRWSALPGASRHHWGTDIDVIDAKALPDGYRVQLTPEEVKPGGMFGPLHEWLDRNMKTDGFYRPYAEDLGGVSPERWHLSYHPLSHQFQSAITPKVVRAALETEPMELKSVVMDHFEEIFARFVLRTNPF